MMWKSSDNKWLNNWIHQAVKFTNELDSLACKQSKLSEKDKADIKECMARLCEINNRNPFNESYSK